MKIPNYDPARLRAVAEDTPLREGRASWHASVHAVWLDGEPAVWKDIGDAPWWARQMYGPILRRESRTLAVLRDLPFTPGLLGRAGAFGFVMERLNGDRLPHLSENNLDAGFFVQLRAALDAMHARHVAHGDLRRKNIFVEHETRRPLILDFGTAVFAGDGASAWRRALWSRVQRLDRLQYAKLKEYYLPGSLDETERAWLLDRPASYRTASWVRRNIYRPLKWRNLRKTYKKWKRRRRNAQGS